MHRLQYTLWFSVLPAVGTHCGKALCGACSSPVVAGTICNVASELRDGLMHRIAKLEGTRSVVESSGRHRPASGQGDLIILSTKYGAQSYSSGVSVPDMQCLRH